MKFKRILLISLLFASLQQFVSFAGPLGPGARPNFGSDFVDSEKVFGNWWCYGDGLTTGMNRYSYTDDNGQQINLINQFLIGNDGSIFHFNENGEMDRNIWRQSLDGNWHYFGPHGVALYNQWIDDTYYVGSLEEAGRMYHDESTPDGYSVGADGKRIVVSSPTPANVPSQSQSKKGKTDSAKATKPKASTNSSNVSSSDKQGLKEAWNKAGNSNSLNAEN